MPLTRGLCATDEELENDLDESELDNDDDDDDDDDLRASIRALFSSSTCLTKPFISKNLASSRRRS